MESGTPQRDTAWAMSEENVEIVRAAFAALNRGDFDAILETYDPHVEFVTLLLGTHHGKEALRTLLEENRQAMPDHRFDLEELIDAGDRVVALVQQRGAGRSSQIAVGNQIAFVFTLKERLVVRQHTFRNKEEALEAAGLRE
jgi:ketosteroid isomerase-like protein